jgi:hypothetical protein
MRNFRPLTPGVAFAALLLGIAGCDSPASRVGPDPYARLSCSDRLAKIGQELQYFEAAKKPAAKRSALDSAAADTAGSSGSINVIWSPPAGFDTSLIKPEGNFDTRPDSHGSYDTTKSATVPWVAPTGSDTLPRTAIPNSIVAVQIVSSEGYRAHIVIYDYHNLPIRTLDQEFGTKGELDNRPATAPRGLVSFLVWDKKDAAGHNAPDGVYLLKIRFTFGSGVVEDDSQLVGLIGDACEAELAD